MLSRREFFGLTKAFAIVGLATGLPLPLGLEPVIVRSSIRPANRTHDYEQWRMFKEVRFPNGRHDIFVRHFGLSHTALVVVPKEEKMAYLQYNAAKAEELIARDIDLTWQRMN